MSAPTISRPSSFAYRKLGWAWVAFCVALSVHVIDEALTGFLSVYNPTVLAMRPANWWFPPTFAFRDWLMGLVLAVMLGLAASPLFFHNHGWVRPPAYFLAIVAGILNAFGHITGTILGHTVGTVRFPRPMPGFYSSPILLAAAAYLLLCLTRTRTSDAALRQDPTTAEC